MCTYYVPGAVQGHRCTPVNKALPWPGPFKEIIEIIEGKAAIYNLVGQVSVPGVTLKTP